MRKSAPLARPGRCVRRRVGFQVAQGALPSNGDSQKFTPANTPFRNFNRSYGASLCSAGMCRGILGLVAVAAAWPVVWGFTTPPAWPTHGAVSSRATSPPSWLPAMASADRLRGVAAPKQQRGRAAALRCSVDDLLAQESAAAMAGFQRWTAYYRVQNITDDFETLCKTMLHPSPVDFR